jgi:hypothetical protein
MIREVLDTASNHADGEEAVTVMLNTPQGKGKQVVDHGKGTSSCFKKKKKKKKKKNDKHCSDDNFVTAVERKMLRPKGNPSTVQGPFREAPRRTCTMKFLSSTHSGSVGS